MENSDYEVSSPADKEEEEAAQLLGKERRTRHLREQRFAWLPTGGETHSSSLKKTFASSRSNSLFFFFLSFPFSSRLFLCLSQGGSQSFGPVSLILSCLPAKLYLGCFLSLSRNCRPTTSLSFTLSLSLPVPLAPPPPPHFSFATAWRKVHFSRVTCRQRYKGICRAFANIT